MTPHAFVQECERRGIVLSLLPPPAPGELPRIHFRVAGKLPEKVRETIRLHKPEIVEAIRDIELAVLGAEVDAELQI